MRDETLTWFSRRLLGAAAATLIALVAVAGLGCGSTVPQLVSSAGVAAYSPVPSDALPVRQADADALARLTHAVQGLRYARADGEFALSPGAFSGLLPHEPSVVTRDVVRIGDVRIFWSVARAETEPTFSEEQIALLRTAKRLTVEVTVAPPTLEAHPGTRAEVFVDEVRAAFNRGIRSGLEELYEGRTVPAHGRVFVLDMTAKVLDDVDEPLPRDPAPLGLRRGEYRYRLGEGLKSPDPQHLTIYLHLWVLPDVPLD